ncbi:MAG: WYL domain-containing protein, partial [Propionicimonas sp.]
NELPPGRRLPCSRPDPATTAQLVQACANRQLVRLGYRSEAGTEWVTRVEPWSVVSRHGRWYLLCRLVRSRGIRTYRLDRVQSVELLDDQFEPPEDLDAVTTLEENMAAGWEFAAEVVIDAPLERVADWVPRSIGRLEPIDEGSCRLVGTTSTPDWYAEMLAALPVGFRIVGGDELRAAARTLGERMLAAAAQPAVHSEASTP